MKSVQTFFFHFWLVNRKVSTLFHELIAVSFFLVRAYSQLCYSHAFASLALNTLAPMFLRPRGNKVTEGCLYVIGFGKFVCF